MRLRLTTMSLVAVLLTGAGTARGNSLVAPGPELQRARALRDGGVALSAIAIACEVVSIALWASWVSAIDDAHSRFGEYAHVPFDLAAGAIATTASVPLLLGVGIPLWSIGARREKGARASISAAGELRF